MARFDVLKSIGHNIADSLSSGMGFMIGVYGSDVFRDAARSPDGHIIVDFLGGKIVADDASPSLVGAVANRESLPTFCIKHAALIEDFKTLTARFGTDSVRRRHFIVTVEDHKGRHSIDAYYEPGGQKPKPRK